MLAGRSAPTSLSRAMSKQHHVVSALLTTDDQDILDYVTGTVEQCVDDGDTSAEALTEALSDLLISYELAPDEHAAAAICVSLSEQLSGSDPVAPQAEQRPNEGPRLVAHAVQIAKVATAKRLEKNRLHVVIGMVAKHHRAMWAGAIARLGTASEVGEDGEAFGAAPRACALLHPYRTELALAEAPHVERHAMPLAQRSHKLLLLLSLLAQAVVEVHSREVPIVATT